MATKSIPRLTYDEKTFEDIEKIKNAKGLNWEDFVLWAAMNVRMKK